MSLIPAEKCKCRQLTVQHLKPFNGTLLRGRASGRGRFADKVGGRQTVHRLTELASVASITLPLMIQQFDV